MWLNQGGSAADLQLLRKNISEAQGLIDRHTIKVLPKDLPIPQDTATARYILEGPDGKKFIIVVPKTVTARQPAEIPADLLLPTARKEFVLVDAAWKEAEDWWKNLTWLNQSAAERLTLARFPSKPESASNYDWEARHREAEFMTEEVLSFNIRRTGWASAAFASGFALLLFLFTLFGWLWRALLARVRELSQAMRGETPL